MGDFQPGDFEQLDADRAAVGLEPLLARGVGDLLRGARDYWTPEKLAEKAKKQLRNPKTKRWMKQRGTLDIPGLEDEAPRADLEPLDLPADAKRRAGQGHGEEVREALTGKGYKRPPPASYKPTPGVTTRRLTPEETGPVLEAAGWSKGRIEKWNGRGVVFQVEHPGQNPAFVFIANPDAMTALKTKGEADLLSRAETDLAEFREENDFDIMTEDPDILEAEQVLIARRDTAARELRAAEAAYARKYGTGGDETVGEWEESIAEEAGDYLARSLRDQLAPWRELRPDGRPAPFMIEFDESMLMLGSNGQTVQANAERGRDLITMDRTWFRTPITSPQMKKFFINDGSETFGQHAAAHEFGHLMDTDLRVDPWFSGRFEKTWKALEAAGIDTTYFKASPREAFAEMEAFARARPNDPRAMMFRSLFMLDQPGRPVSPPGNWERDHLAWLVRAMGTGPPLKPLPKYK